MDQLMGSLQAYEEKEKTRGAFGAKCQTDVQEKANLVGDKEEGEEPTLFLILNKENDDKSLWYLDNGA
ncbi:hypothetical protein CR513_51892, partial [Mucuna pruriens]